MKLTGDHVSTGIAIVVQNGRPWTYFGERPMTVSKTAAVDTGRLSATVVQPPRPWDYPSLVWRAFSGHGVDGHPRLSLHDEESFTVVPLDGQLLDIHVDGDHMGRFEKAEYRVDRDSMLVLG
jgi:diacylglycerol kinase family enzyme